MIWSRRGQLAVMTVSMSQAQFKAFVCMDRKCTFGFGLRGLVCCRARCISLPLSKRMHTNYNPCIRCTVRCGPRPSCIDTSSSHLPRLLIQFCCITFFILVLVRAVVGRGPWAAWPSVGRVSVWSVDHHPTLPDSCQLTVITYLSRLSSHLGLWLQVTVQCVLVQYTCYSSTSTSTHSHYTVHGSCVLSTIST